MEKFKRTVPDVLLVAGAGIVAVGCGMVYLPLGVIVAGLDLIAFALLSSAGGGAP